MNEKKLTAKQQAKLKKMLMAQKRRIAKKQPRMTKKEKKMVIRLKMKNLSYLSKHSDRCLVKISHENGDYFPRQILDIKDERERAEMKKLYMELVSGLKLQKKYRKNHLQKEPALLKLSKMLGIFPQKLIDDSPAVRDWEARMETIRRAKLAKKAAWHAARNNRKRPAYSVTLASESTFYTPIKPRRVKRSLIGKIVYKSTLAKAALKQIAANERAEIEALCEA